MELPVSAQALTFLQASLLAVLLGVWYDALRVLRHAFSRLTGLRTR